MIERQLTCAGGRAPWGTSGITSFGRGCDTLACLPSRERQIADVLPSRTLDHRIEDIISPLASHTSSRARLATWLVAVLTSAVACLRETARTPSVKSFARLPTISRTIDWVVLPSTMPWVRVAFSLTRSLISRSRNHSFNSLPWKGRERTAERASPPSSLVRSKLNGTAS